MTQQKTKQRSIKVGVVGLGFMGVTHLRAYLQIPGAHIAAVCDAVRLPVNGVLAGVAGNVTQPDDIHLGRDVKVFKNFSDVLNDPSIDLVDLCTPTPLHAGQAIAALRAGKDVFCEKPMARTSKDAAEIVRAEKESGKRLMPAMCMRFWPGWSWLKEVVTDERYGKVLAARFRRVTGMPTWSTQGTYNQDLGGALFDLHIHDTDFVQYLFGRPQSVFSSGILGQGGAVDHVVTSYNYPGGPSVHAEGNWYLPKGFNMAYSLYCQRATIDFDLARGAGSLQVTEHGKETQVLPLEGDGYSGEIRYLIETLQAGKAPQTVTAADGLSALEICEAEEQSIRTGQVVSLG